MEHSSYPGHGNSALQGLLDEARMSNAALARAVVRLGADEGVHLGTSPTSIKRMLDGVQPRWPVPRLVAAALSRKLAYDVTVAQCGFVTQNHPADTFDAFECQPTIGGTIATVAELSERDMDRRNFLLGSAFSAAAFAQPAWLALTMPPAAASRSSGGTLGAADVQVILDTVRHFEQLQRRFGGGAVREQIVQFVHHHTRTTLRREQPERIASDLFAAIAQATWLAGLASIDTGRHALGQQYYTQALNLSTQSGDRLFAANVLSEMSRVTIDVGNTSTDPTTARQHGQRAAALARSAIQVANGSTTPAFGAWLHAIEARGLTLLGRDTEAIQAVDDAQRSYERAGDPDPEWFGYYSEADLLSDAGQCLRDAGRPRQGIALLERAATQLPNHRVTAQTKTQIHIAAAHLELHEYDAANHVTSDAITAAGNLSSRRIMDRLDGLRRRTREHGQHRDLQQLRDRITTALA